MGKSPQRGGQSQACVVRFEPRSDAQYEAARLYASSDVLFLLGPAGCGKTVAAVGLAAADVVSPGSPRRRVVCVRPAVEADRGLGFLPGDLNEKLAPYTQPVKHSLAKVSYRFPAELISYEALAFARGVTYEDCVVILDEAQNCSAHQLKLFLTRLGRNCRMVVTGDPGQSDVRATHRDYDCDLDYVVERLEGLPGVGVVDFPEGDSLRHPLVGRILARLQD